MNNIFNVENGDTLIVSIDPSVGPAGHNEYVSGIHELFRDQQIKILFTQRDITFSIIKSSNLDDNRDSKLRDGNPALQDAWEQYQIIKNLAKDTDDTT